MTEISKSKKWYRRKRLWFLAAIVLLVYFCFVPSRLRISPETTFVTDPLTADGQVDYFGAFEQTYLDRLSPPEDNGLRLLIAAFGPRILDQYALFDAVSWEESPNYNSGDNWFNNTWIPLCEHIQIDPYQRPMFYDKRTFFRYMRELFTEQKKASGEVADKKSIDNDCEKLQKKLTSEIWKKADYPDAAKWLDDYSEALDYYGKCVRKPNFACWRQRPKNGDLTIILLSEIKDNRLLARNLRVRISERIGRGDIENAWYDIMTLKHHVRHYINENFLVTNLTGISINALADSSIKLILTQCRPTEEQLARFADDLNELASLSDSTLLKSLKNERIVSFQILQFLQAGKKTGVSEYDENFNFIPGIPIERLPFDLNIAGKRLTKLYGDFGLKDSLRFISNPTLRRRYYESIEQSIQKLADVKDFKKQWYRIPLIRTRSELMAECVFINYVPSIVAMNIALERYDAQNELQRIAIGLERYKLSTGKYPEKLSDLVPKYFDMMPIDPCTGRATFVYKLRDQSKSSELQLESVKSLSDSRSKSDSPNYPKTPYILYSLGPDGKDDGGTPQNQSNSDYDYVFE
jgi:hypothetical protein